MVSSAFGDSRDLNVSRFYDALLTREFMTRESNDLQVLWFELSLLSVDNSVVGMNYHFSGSWLVHSNAVVS
jgi:fumarate reductase subunit C